jgi:hypothetical protein
VNDKTRSNSARAGQASSEWRTFKDRDEWIADILATPEKALGWRAAIKTLEKSGWLMVDRSRGRHRNTFRLLAPTLQAGCRVQPSKRVEGLANAQPFKNRVPNPSTNGTNPSDCLHPNSESRTAKDRTANIDSPRLDLRDDDSGRRPVQTPDDVDSHFETWWKQVPRRVAKAAAAKIFRRIVEKREATVDQLMAGIIRYAGEVANREERYVAHPSTWLSQGRWHDEPAKPAGNTIDNRTGNPVRPPPPNQSGLTWDEVGMVGMRGRP